MTPAIARTNEDVVNFLENLAREFSEVATDADTLATATLLRKRSWFQGRADTLRVCIERFKELEANAPYKTMEPVGKFYGIGVLDGVVQKS